jgi:putative aminopeptidase FrvX
MPLLAAGRWSEYHAGREDQKGRQLDAPLCCLAAHMDEIGLVVSAIESE